MLETPLKWCSQKCTFFWHFGTGSKAPVPKKLLKVFQNIKSHLRKVTDFLAANLDKFFTLLFFSP
jgi:wyosine [tRNA(Phe)-imidazoG37] synthetase (radical SAM superfamily)